MTRHDTTRHDTTRHDTIVFHALKKLFAKTIRKVKLLHAKSRIYFLWPLFSSMKNWKGTTTKNYDRHLIISLTSFPARINIVHKVIKSLMLQKMKANEIILWLAESEFPEKENALPKSLLHLKKYGLKILWCENLRSYKKLIPALKNFPDSNIVTADDDLYYRYSWLYDLYETHKKFPEDICAHRITKFFLDENNNFAKIGGGYDFWRDGSYLNKLTGGAGAIFPVGSSYRDVINSEIFTRVCPTNDDIWFWLMGVLNGRKIRATKNNLPHLLLAYVGDTQKGPTLCSINDSGENLFWKDFYNMLKYYPELEKILREEYKNKNGA